MKPFDLEKALAGEPVQTRDGRKVIDFHYFEKANCINGRKIVYCDESGSCTWVDESGGYNGSSGNDLFMVSEPKKVPLTQEDWIKGGPWWVKVNSPGPNRVLNLVFVAWDDGSIRVSAADLLNQSVLMDRYERTRDGINFEPCYKVE